MLKNKKNDTMHISYNPKTKTYSISFGRNRKTQKDYMFDKHTFEFFAERIADFVSEQNK